MKNRAFIEKTLAYVIVVCVVAEVLLVVGSWAISSSFPDCNIHSLLDSEGIRWFFGHFTSNLQNPFLVWMILFGVGGNVFLKSRLPFSINKAIHGEKINFRERIGLSLVAFEILFAIAVMSFLCLMPQAILLSVSGDLFPSSFSNSIVAALSFVLLVAGTTFALATDKIRNPLSWFAAMRDGVVAVAPFLVAYVFVVQLLYSVCFVFALAV